MEPSSKNKLKLRVSLSLVLAIVLLAAFFFIPAGTLNYWQAWVYLAILFLPMIGVEIYFLKHDPILLERRMQAREKTIEQKKIIRLTYPIFLITFLLPGFDRRFGWTHTPAVVIIAADIVVLLSYYFFFLVLRENSYASRIIEVSSDQRVIDTGPYALIRHPMYTAVVLLYLLSPLALGSWLAMIPTLLLIPLIILRALDEEKTLARDLKGYKEYMQRVKYRMLPGIW